MADDRPDLLEERWCTIGVAIADRTLRQHEERFRLMGELQRLTNPRQPAVRGDDAQIKERLATLQDQLGDQLNIRFLQGTSVGDLYLNLDCACADPQD